MTLLLPTEISRMLSELRIAANQLGQHNLTPDQYSILRGRRYNRTKKKHGAEPGGRGNQHEVKCQSDTLPDTATALAEKHGVSRRSIIRDGKRAEALEQLAKTQPDEAQAVRDGKKRSTEELGKHLGWD